MVAEMLTRKAARTRRLWGDQVLYDAVLGFTACCNSSFAGLQPFDASVSSHAPSPNRRRCHALAYHVTPVRLLLLLLRLQAELLSQQCALTYAMFLYCVEHTYEGVYR
jgi:hypothetical protein